MTIKYEGKNYPSRFLHVCCMGIDKDVLISTVSLEQDMMDSEGRRWKGPVERAIDKSIFMYLKDENWGITDEQLLSMVDHFMGGDR